MATQNKKGEALPKIEDVLGKLTERRKRLDEADSRISTLIQNLEIELQTHLNIRVSTDITDYVTNGFPTTLAFGKHDGKWQLTVEVDFPDGSEEKTPLLSCSRETRVRMFSEGHIEALIRGAVAQLDKQLAVREKAIETATDLVHALGGIVF